MGIDSRLQAASRTPEPSPARKAFAAALCTCGVRLPRKRTFRHAAHQRQRLRESRRRRQGAAFCAAAQLPREAASGEHHRREFQARVPVGEGAAGAAAALGGGAQREPDASLLCHSLRSHSSTSLEVCSALVAGSRLRPRARCHRASASRPAGGGGHRTSVSAGPIAARRGGRQGRAVKALSGRRAGELCLPSPVLSRRGSARGRNGKVPLRGASLRHPRPSPQTRRASKADLAARALTFTREQTKGQEKGRTGCANEGCHACHPDDRTFPLEPLVGLGWAVLT